MEIKLENPSPETDLPANQILGVKVHSLSVAELHEQIASYINLNRRGLIQYVNAYCLNSAYENAKLRKCLNSGNIVFCDGAGVVLASKILRGSISRRITYADWMWQLAEFAEARKYTFFFLGAAPGIAEKAADRLREKFPGLQIVGMHHGYFDKTPGSIQNENIIETINGVRPNILVIGFGVPLQEYWLMENKHRIQANVMLTGGAVFDYISGNLQRGPRWMTDHGMEWLARLLIEPLRLWRRYVLGNPLFLWRVVCQRLGMLEKAGDERM